MSRYYYGFMTIKKEGYSFSRQAKSYQKIIHTANSSLLLQND
ncbi:hypothetical protein NST77_24915 [Niallia sp. FSL W8-0177]